MTIIEFRGVSFVHQTGVTALTDVSLTVGKGETVAIVGENGAGKTTLVRHTNGLLKPTKGSVLVDGVETRQTTAAALSRKVGIAFQNPDHQLFSDSVESEVRFAMKNFGLPEGQISERLEWALDFFGLSQYRKSSPLVLSGGEKKRLTLACILAWDPEVVVLDEPTVGQDALQKEKLARIFKTLQATGKTIIVVSHDVEFLWPIQPRLLVMSGGKLVADGPMSSVMADRGLLERARVTQPQLLRLYSGLSRRPGSPFLDVDGARRWVAGGLVGKKEAR
ncbi:MAG TPA: ABC transporter ATP-binding protein [Nitrososphaerales archaeon]|nr:ABC transporter ATP-binding protein [Nitrososphaerales archaeon]